VKENKNEIRSVRIYDLFRGPRGGVFFFLREHRLLLFKKRNTDTEPTEEGILHYRRPYARSPGSEESWLDWE
jgi:hypothetical protein